MGLPNTLGEKGSSCFFIFEFKKFILKRSILHFNFWSLTQLFVSVGVMFGFLCAVRLDHSFDCLLTPSQSLFLS